MTLIELAFFAMNIWIGLTVSRVTVAHFGGGWVVSGLSFVVGFSLIPAASTLYDLISARRAKKKPPSY